MNKSKKKFFKKSRTKNTKVTIDSVINLIKQGELEQAVEILLKSIKSKKDVVDCFMYFINQSNFRAYSLALKQFNYVIHDYNKTKNTAILKSYVEVLNKETGKENFYTEFTFLRLDIIYYLLNIPGHSIFSMATRMLYVLGTYDRAKFNKITIDFICLLAEKKWPGKTKGLKVLYGSS